MSLYRRDDVGKSTIIMVLALLAMNTVIIIVVSLQSAKRKCYLRSLKKKQAKAIKEM